MTTLLLLVLFLPLLLFLADGNWRNALLYSVVIGFLQDPLRKITPDQPSLYVGLVLIGIGLTASLLYSRIGRLALNPLFSNDRRLIGVVEVFLGLLVLQTLIGVVQVGSLPLTLVGLGFYLAPVLSLWLGFQFALQPAAVQRFLRLYMILALLFTFTLLLSYRGIQHPLLEEVGDGLLINFVELGTMAKGFVGLWRSSEIAGWHLGAAACFALILGISTRKPDRIALATALAVALLVISTLTGRRKVFTLVAGFVGFYGLLIAWRGDPRVRSSVLAGMGSGGLLLGLLLALGGNPTESGTLAGTMRRSLTVWDSVLERFNNLGFNAIAVSLEAAGPFGVGIGSAAQGAQSLGIQVSNVSWAGEGGLGKIAIELGVAGIGLFALIAVLLGALFWRIVHQLRYAPPSYALLNFGLIAFVAGNLPNFSVASQVYGDPFVLSILGLCSGFVLASPLVLQAHLRAQRQSVATPQLVAAAGGAGP